MSQQGMHSGLTGSANVFMTQRLLVISTALGELAVAIGYMTATPFLSYVRSTIYTEAYIWYMGCDTSILIVKPAQWEAYRILKTKQEEFLNTTRTGAKLRLYTDTAVSGLRRPRPCKGQIGDLQTWLRLSAWKRRWPWGAGRGCDAPYAHPTPFTNTRS